MNKIIACRLSSHAALCGLDRVLNLPANIKRRDGCKAPFP